MSSGSSHDPAATAGRGPAGPGPDRPRFNLVWWGGALLLFAFALRAIYLIELRALPFFADPILDGRGYLAWARQLAAGDWGGQGVFYQAPLYPYSLGVLMRLGAEVGTIRFVQAGLGALSCLLVAIAGARLFSPRAGVIGGLLLACYAPVIFYDTLIQKANLNLLLTTAMLAIWAAELRHPRAPRATRWAVLGMLWALLALTRENMLLAAAPFLLWVWLYYRRARVVRRQWLCSAAFCLAALVVFAPVTLRNLIVGGELALTTSQAGVNFFMGNNARASGWSQSIVHVHGDPAYERRDATALAEQALGRKLTPQQVSGYWAQRALDFVRNHPGAWLQLMAWKAFLVWHSYEIADGLDFYFLAQESRTLGALAPITHLGLLVPLGLLGALLVRRRRRELWLLHLLALVTWGGVTLFFVTGRYRLGLVPLLVLLAAGGIDQLWTELRRRRSSGSAWRCWRELRAWLPASLAVLAAVLICNWPLATPPPQRALAYTNLAYTLVRDGRLDEAEQHFRAALRSEPDAAHALQGLGMVRMRRGHTGDALRYLQQAVQRAPSYGQAQYNLGLALLELGRSGGAIDALQRAVQLRPHHAESHFNLAVALAREGRRRAAIEALNAGLQRRPGDAGARALLARLHAEQRTQRRPR